jgi:hypothetical protein
MSQTTQTKKILATIKSNKKIFQKNPTKKLKRFKTIVKNKSSINISGLQQ